MGLSEKDVLYVADLARLELSPAEVETMVRQLGRILDYVGQLAELDTAAVPPTSHVLPLVNVLRDDEPVPSAAPETMLAGAPEREKGHYRVPKVIGG